MESLFSLDADPAVLEADVSVSVMQVNGICALAVSAFCVYGHRVVGSHVVTIVSGLACHRVVGGRRGR